MTHNALRASLRNFLMIVAAILCFAIAWPVQAQLADKLKIGVFPSSSSLPFYVALERGYFKEVGIEVEAIPMNTHPLTVQALVAGDIDGASNLVSLEVANINQRRPNTATFISLNGQNAQYITEQFVVKAGSPAVTLKDLKGAKLFSAPGPANLGAAKAVLKAVGLEENKDYTIAEQPMGLHLGALQAGTFDAGYTLEPIATLMIRQGVGKRLEAGVISTYLLGAKDAQAFAAGCVLSGKLLAEKPQLAARFARAWARAVEDTMKDPKAREYLVKLNVSPELAPIIPLAKITMVKDLGSRDLGDFQKFVDTGVEFGVIRASIDVKSFIKAY